MRKGETVTLNQVSAAALAVQTELGSVGLWSEACRLPQTEAIWCYLPQVVASNAVGFFWDGESSTVWKWLGYEPGNIYIPQWVLSQGPWGQDRGSLRDILRHEYGHALAWHYPALVRRSRRFVEAFGSRYDDPEPGVGPRSAFVSYYASTMPAEDFAETFAVWLRRGGRCPEHYRNRALRRKWAFVRDVVHAIESGALRF